MNDNDSCFRHDFEHLTIGEYRCKNCGMGIVFEVDPPFCKWCGSPMDDRQGKVVREIGKKIKEQTEKAGLPLLARLLNPELFKAMGKVESNKSVWANALLSDGKILFWYTGDKCGSADDFYKDFYYSGIKQTKYEKTHKLELVCKELDASDNHKAFEADAPEFYRQYEISPDSKGKKPYGENVPFVPPICEQMKGIQSAHPAYITPDYETISTAEKRQLAELMESSLLNGFNQQDFQDIVSVFNRVCNRLLLIAEERK